MNQNVPKMHVYISAMKILKPYETKFWEIAKNPILLNWQSRE